MSNDTERALEIIKPMADVLGGLIVKADDDFLYIEDIAIGISCNSTWATLMEFIGYVVATKYSDKFRRIDLKPKQLEQIKRYWFTRDLLAKMNKTKGDA